MEYIVAGLSFPTKQALALYVQAMLQSYAAGDTCSPADTAFLSEFVLRHPSADVKVGAGIAGFRVARVAFSSNDFILDRVDGSSVDFSYRQCIRPVLYHTKVKFAMRRAIADQVIAVKREVLPNRDATMVCPLTGETVGYNDVHVDHIPPMTFAALVQRYLGERNATFDDVALVPDENGIGWHLADGWFEDWSRWHHRHAQLRVISAAANLALAAELARTR